MTSSYHRLWKLFCNQWLYIYRYTHFTYYLWTNIVKYLKWHFVYFFHCYLCYFIIIINVQNFFVYIIVSVFLDNNVVDSSKCTYYQYIFNCWTNCKLSTMSYFSLHSYSWEFLSQSAHWGFSKNYFIISISIASGLPSTNMQTIFLSLWDINSCIYTKNNDKTLI